MIQLLQDIWEGFHSSFTFQKKDKNKTKIEKKEPFKYLRKGTHLA